MIERECLWNNQHFFKDRVNKKTTRENSTADERPMLPNHAYLSLVIPPQDRILLAIALVFIAAVLAYFLVKALLFSAERESIL
jgi:hypothetical protein